MTTLTAALIRNALVHGHRPAMLEADGRRRTWLEWRDRVSRLARVLAGRGTGVGTRVGVLSPNSVRQAELFHALYWLGAVPVPINTRLAPPEVADLLETTRVQWLAVDPAAASLLEATTLAPMARQALRLGSDEVEAALAGADPHPPADLDGHAEALLLHTGGTAGRPKCVVLTHGNAIANALQVSMAWPAGPDDVMLHVAPMFHSADLVMTGALLRGAAHAYLPRFTPAELLAAVVRHRVSALMVVPTMLMMLVDSGEIPRHDVGSLRRILYGASPLPRPAVARAMQALPAVSFTQGYGLTETAPLLCMLDHDGHRQALQETDAPLSCGHPLPGVDLRIQDPEGRELPPGEAGEIVARGANVFGRYLDLPEHTAEVLRGGWFHTGDIGMQGADGRVYILDRKKDMVIVNGEKVYSVEVEAALAQHPDVAEVAVIGIPAGRQGEAVFAVIVPRPGATLHRKALREFCRSRIGAYKLPTGFAFVDALPRTALGKVMKERLRQEHGG